MLTWTETHEQAIIVARHLQRISHIDRRLAGHMPVHAGLLKTVALMLDSARRGKACVRKPWTRKRVRTRSIFALQTRKESRR
jgi:hypothetical protein